MAKITQEMKDLIAKVRICIAATADQNGLPNASYKGSLQILDDEHLIFADFNSLKTRKNLEENKQICILVADPANRLGYQFKGDVELLTEGEIYDKLADLYAKRAPKAPRPKYVVKVNVKEIYEAK